MPTTPAAGSPLEYQSPPPKPRPKRRWLLKIVIAVGLLAGAIGVLLPTLCAPRETANRAKCASNLHQIGLAIQMYANDHHGEYPDSFATILTSEQVTPAMFVCPSSNDMPATGSTTAEVLADFAKPGHVSYIYLGRGLKVDTARADTVVAYDQLDNHKKDGANALFGDGHVSWNTPAELKQALANSAGATTTPTTEPVR